VTCVTHERVRFGGSGEQPQVHLNIRYPIVSFEAADCLKKALRSVRSTKVLRILSHSITLLLHVAIVDPRPGLDEAGFGWLRYSMVVQPQLTWSAQPRCSASRRPKAGVRPHLTASSSFVQRYAVCLSINALAIPFLTLLPNISPHPASTSHNID
jgi:hypothetical protein